MKRNTLRRNLLIAFFISMNVGFITAQDSVLSADDKTYVKNLTYNIQSSVEKAINVFEIFIDKKNREPYRIHLNRYQNAVKQIQINIIIPLQHRIQLQDKSSSSVLFNTLKNTHEVLSELHRQLNQIYVLLDRHKTKKPLFIANALGKQIDVLQTKVSYFNRKLQALYINLTNLGLNNEAQQLDKIRKILIDWASKPGLSKTEKMAIVKAIAVKLRRK